MTDSTLTTKGVRGEEREDFTAAESKRLRERSLALLALLLRPLKVRLVVTGKKSGYRTLTSTSATIAVA